MSIAVIAGLGNPGSKYRDTRHNIGFVLIDHLAKKQGAAWHAEVQSEAQMAMITYEHRKCLLIKPQTYMNDSGRSLCAILRYRKLSAESLLILHDNITLDFGRAKLSHSGNSGGHNGVADLITQVGSGFSRYQIGVGGKPNREMKLADYVLSQFTRDESKILANKMPVYLEHLELIMDKGIELAMNLINQRTSTQV